MPTNRWEVPVLIVGGGPAGLVSALALSRYGVDYVLVDRHPGTAHTPRAHIVNQRTVEILRHLGIEDRFHAVAMPQELMANNLWVTSLAGQEIIRTETWGTSARRAGEYRAASPCPMANCPQTVFEPMLVDAIRDAGGDLRFHHELETFAQDDEGVTSTVRNRETGELLTVRSRYLIGADGARSQILGLAGLSIDGAAGLGHAANVWFEADLSRHLTHRPGVLVWNLMPGPYLPLRLGTLICHKPFTEFVLVFPYDPEQEDIELTPDDLKQKVRAAIGDDGIEVTIKGLAGWQVNAQVASVYSAGRVFCMGDAVHRHPPTNGLGLNMSAADAYNLAWKLALVLDGRAGPGLLETGGDGVLVPGAHAVVHRQPGEVVLLAEVKALRPVGEPHDGHRCGTAELRQGLDVGTATSLGGQYLDQGGDGLTKLMLLLEVGQAAIGAAGEGDLFDTGQHLLHPRRGWSFGAEEIDHHAEGIEPGSVVEHGVDGRVAHHAAIPVQLAVDLHRRERRGQGQAGQDVLHTDGFAGVVEIADLAGADVHGAETESGLAGVDAIEVDEPVERPVDRKAVVVAERAVRTGRRQPGAHQPGSEEPRVAQQ